MLFLACLSVSLRSSIPPFLSRPSYQHSYQPSYLPYQKRRLSCEERQLGFSRTMIASLRSTSTNLS